MKQILIRYEEPVTELEATRYVYNALKYDTDRKGVIKFEGGAMLAYSDTAKHIAITIYKDKKNEGNQKI